MKVDDISIESQKQAIYCQIAPKYTINQDAIVRFQFMVIYLLESISQFRVNSTSA